MALAIGLRRPDVIWHFALWSPDFPRRLKSPRDRPINLGWTVCESQYNHKLYLWASHCKLDSHFKLNALHFMSRYRPPRPRSSPYITPEGYRSLEKELKALWRKRAEVTIAVTAAAAEGDRSENAEYIYRKKQLREIDRRIRYLQKRMPDLKLVPKVANENIIYFSAWITVYREDDSEFEYRIVGADEIDSDSSKGYISVDSPLARALLGKQVGDEVSIIIAEETRVYEVLAIRYR